MRPQDGRVGTKVRVLRLVQAIMGFRGSCDEGAERGS